MRPSDRALYVISVAAELAGMHPQTLRIYERKGLVEPARTQGGSRRYSDDDIAQLQRIQDLTAEGHNLEGVRRILELEDHVAALSARVRQLEEQVAAAEYALAVTMADRGSARNLPAVPPARAAQSMVLWRRRG